jgi:hypothetical protein
MLFGLERLQFQVHASRYAEDRKVLRKLSKNLFAHSVSKVRVRTRHQLEGQPMLALELNRELRMQKELPEVISIDLQIVDGYGFFD